MDQYKYKYLKYKAKYLDLTNSIKKIGGAYCDQNDQHIRSAAGIVLSNDKKWIYLLRNRRGEWMTPAGMVDKEDHKCWTTFTREFKEEVGQDLPTNNKSNKEQSFIHGNPPHTRIYIIYVDKDSIKYNIDNVLNDETNAANWFNLDELIKNDYKVFHNSKYEKMVNYVKNSLKEAINKFNF